MGGELTGSTRSAVGIYLLLRSQDDNLVHRSGFLLNKRLNYKPETTSLASSEMESRSFFCRCISKIRMDLADIS